MRCKNDMMQLVQTLVEEIPKIRMTLERIESKMEKDK